MFGDKRKQAEGREPEKTRVKVLNIYLNTFSKLCSCGLNTANTANDESTGAWNANALAPASSAIRVPTNTTAEIASQTPSLNPNFKYVPPTYRYRKD